MFNLSCTEEAELAGVIRHRKGEHPMRLGPYTDMDGNRWDIRILFSPGFKGGWAAACPNGNLHPYFSDTSGASYGMVMQRWEPYALEIVDD